MADAVTENIRAPQGRHGDRGLGRIDHGNAERVLECGAVPRHSRAAHDDDIRPVHIPKFEPDFDHPGQRTVAGSGFRDAHPQWTLACEAIDQAKLVQIALVPPYRLFRDGDDAKSLAARQRR